MKRVILVVLDGCGVGAMPDAAHFGRDDLHSATLPHVALAAHGLHLPCLQSLGLGCIVPILGVAPKTRVAAGDAWRKPPRAKTA